MTSFPEDYSKQEIGEILAEYRVFQQAREHAMASAQLPPDDTEISFGEPPFIIHDDPTFYAVLFRDGSVEPLPFGYRFNEDDLTIPDTVFINFNTIMFGGRILRYWPLRPEFEMPDDSSFEMDRACQALADDQTYLDGLSFNGFRYSDAKTGKPFTGKAKTTWTNGNLRREAQLSHGRFDGKLTWWYESGQKELETEYVDGERHGKHRTWHENGQRWADMKYVSGCRQGRCRWWYDNGQLKEEATYVDDELHGVARQWYENGNLLVEVELVDGARQGPLRQWHANGQLAVEVSCVDDEPHGRMRQWDEDGDLVSESQWEYGEQRIILQISEEEEEEEDDDDVDIDSLIGSLDELFALDDLADDDEQLDSEAREKLETLRGKLAGMQNDDDDNGKPAPETKRKRTKEKSTPKRQKPKTKTASRARKTKKPIDEVVKPGLIRFQYDDCMNKEAAVRQRMQLHLKVALKPLFEKGTSMDATEIIAGILKDVHDLEADDSFTIPIVVEGNTVLTFEFVR